MNLDVQSRGFTLTRSLRTAVERETLDFEVAEDCTRLKVRLFDVNGVRGGVDKGCLLTLHRNRGRRVLVASDIDADLYRAIPGAFEKLRRALGDVSRRSRSLRRRKLSRPVAS